MRRLTPLLLAGGVAGIATLAARRWLDAVEVEGDSMAPTLLPGELLIVERLTLARRPPRNGDVVLAADPRQPTRELVKRVAAYDPGTDRVELRGDATEASTDSRSFGSVPREEVCWRVALRYWPPDRIGRP